MNEILEAIYEMLDRCQGLPQGIYDILMWAHMKSSIDACELLETIYGMLRGCI